MRALDLVGTQWGRKGIVIFSDGDDRHSLASREAVLERVEASDAMIYTIGFGTGASDARLAQSLESYVKRCQKNLKRWQREAELIMGNAEELPFQDGVFDSVFHVGGINAFNDREKAICEMIRVARAGTKIVIVDETAKLMQAVAWMPTARKWLQEHGERFAAPVQLVPEGMSEVQAKDCIKGNLYCLTFRKP